MYAESVLFLVLGCAPKKVGPTPSAPATEDAAVETATPPEGRCPPPQERAQPGAYPTNQVGLSIRESTDSDTSNWELRSSGTTAGVVLSALNSAAGTKPLRIEGWGAGVPIYASATGTIDELMEAVATSAGLTMSPRSGVVGDVGTVHPNDYCGDGSAPASLLLEHDHATDFAQLIATLLSSCGGHVTSTEGLVIVQDQESNLARIVEFTRRFEQGQEEGVLWNDWHGYSTGMPGPAPACTSWAESGPGRAVGELLLAASTEDIVIGCGGALRLAPPVTETSTEDLLEAAGLSTLDGTTQPLVVANWVVTDQVTLQQAEPVPGHLARLESANPGVLAELLRSSLGDSIVVAEYRPTNVVYVGGPEAALDSAKKVQAAHAATLNSDE